MAWFVILVNALLAFGFTRVFCRVFLGKPQQMSERSPEIHWPMALPMMLLVGFSLHLPLILSATDLLPNWVEINKDAALLLAWSTMTGIALSAVVYLGNAVAKPVKLPWQGLQDLFAYDFYTPQLYRNTIILLIAVISKLTDLFDKYLIDGLANLFGVVTLFGGQSLKYSTSGQSQFYALTIVVGLALLGLWLSYPMLSQLKLSF
jgi:NAD(P)H-quinone oxidoreductase subunit 5